MEKLNLEIKEKDPNLYSEDLAPLPVEKRGWGWFEIFNVWANDIQSLFGYTLAASLFLSYGLNGWAVFVAILISGFFIMYLVNLTGKPSVKYGIPYPVMARVSMGVKGANFPAIVRGIVAIFWYGVQTYFASTAVSLLITSLTGWQDSSEFLDIDGIGWLSFTIVWLFQIVLFWNGIDAIGKFLNWAGPLVYVVMIGLMIALWYQAGSGLLSQVGSIFSGDKSVTGGGFSSFIAVIGTMVSYFGAVVINYGDFSRFVKTEENMKKGNLIGLPINMAFFSFLALFITAGTVVVFGEKITNPTDIVKKVDSVFLSVIAAITFFAATVGINVVANLVPPAYDIANLAPSKISFRVGCLITSIIGFFIGAFWVSFISKIGIVGFVNTLGAILAPIYGIMILDYYITKKENIDIQDLYTNKKSGKYFYQNGWNQKALIAFVLASIFSVSSVWIESLSFLSGYAWILGALLGAILYHFLMKNSK